MKNSEKQTGGERSSSLHIRTPVQMKPADNKPKILTGGTSQKSVVQPFITSYTTPQLINSTSAKQVLVPVAISANRGDAKQGSFNVPSLLNPVTYTLMSNTANLQNTAFVTRTHLPELQ